MTITASALDQFCGTENYYRHGLVRDVVYTDGVQFLAEQIGAHWLIDLIASHQTNAKVRHEPFQVWTLERKDGGAVAYVRADTNRPRIVEQEMEYTDFPFDDLGDKFELWLVDGSIDGKNSVKVLMLKSEY